MAVYRIVNMGDGYEVQKQEEFFKFWKIWKTLYVQKTMPIRRVTKYKTINEAEKAINAFNHVDKIRGTVVKIYNFDKEI